ncbi:hypothetical protein JTB14_009962 [Gonioctena quinquepunctata]|nr:hypothetical protein JTB14_009962 [Gonioctena quinquepunctata]
MSIEELRRSSRVTKGIPPIRLGNEDEGVPKSQREQHEMARENGNHEKQSISSKGTRTTSTSLVRRRNIQAELEAHRKLAEIAKKELEIEKNLIQKELELNRLAELDDIQKGVESVVLGDFSNIKENISEDTSRRRRVKYDEIQQWVDTAPSDNSFNCDFSCYRSTTIVKIEEFHPLPAAHTLIKTLVHPFTDTTTIFEVDITYSMPVRDIKLIPYPIRGWHVLNISEISYSIPKPIGIFGMASVDE